MESIKINDNINLYYVPMTKLKTTAIGVYIHRELRADEVSENALLPYVLKRGCKLCPTSEAVAKYLENLYGASFGASVMKIGDDQIIYFGFEAISDKYAPEGEKLSSDIIKLMLSVLFEPSAFTEEVTEQEKKNARDRVLAEINEKIIYARNRCTEEIFKEKAFALSPLGTVDSIGAVNAGSLKAHYEKIITASPIDIYICGDADIHAAAEEIKSYTSKLSFTPASLSASEIFERTGSVKNITDHMEVNQGKLCMGFATRTEAADASYPALMVMNSVFGGGAHSKLFNNVREKLSLCYYASSSLIRNKGVMLVNAGIEFQNFEKAKSEILAQLDAVKSGEISDLEFTSRISALLNQLESYKDDQRLMQIFCLGQTITGTNDDIDTLKEKISRVKRDDVKHIAERIELDTVYFLAGEEARS